MKNSAEKGEIDRHHNQKMKNSGEDESSREQVSILQYQEKEVEKMDCDFLDKYYLCDAAYANARRFLAPYRNTRYWLADFRRRRALTREEKFNHAHAQLRNVIERAYGVLKARFPILKQMAPFPFTIQRNVDTIFNNEEEAEGSGEEELDISQWGANSTEYMATLRDGIANKALVHLYDSGLKVSQNLCRVSQSNRYRYFENTPCRPLVNDRSDGRFARIGNNEITILVNDAEKSGDIDPHEAQQTLEIAEAALRKVEGKRQTIEANLALRRARTRVEERRELGDEINILDVSNSIGSKNKYMKIFQRKTSVKRGRNSKVEECSTPLKAKGKTSEFFFISRADQVTI
ncbi:hypothetical protein OSB04_010539 [Centaurea solstitialis]|uniref:DDE Tnp4 domain-containing protein n=1 Tax=Centaurea solstitialis TaxID=347529 RepID=A0AA38TJJ8_9ASTR|nr:hypothetical protein OSB04_010539 [Centaurea solstitialis]